MTEEQYNGKIIKYVNQLTNQNAKDINAKLDMMFDIKPVRTVWYAAKALALITGNFEKNATKAFGMMDGKIWGIDNPYGIDLFYKVYKIKANRCKDYVDLRRMTYECEMIQEHKDSHAIRDEIMSMESTLSKWDGNTVTGRELFINLLDLCYIQNKYVEYAILYEAYKYFWPESYYCVREWCMHDTNMDYLREMLKINSLFIIVASQDDNTLYELIACYLAKMDKKVVYIHKPLKVNVDGPINIQNTLEISIENKEESRNCITFTPVELWHEEKYIGDNRELIINYATENYSESKLSTILCSGKMMNELTCRESLRKNTQRLYNFRFDFCEDNMVFGWHGDYLAYISLVYNEDTKSLIHKVAEKKFSIVVPARNSADTLRYTLQTCLNQTYKGDYEIIVSDNSTGQNASVYQLCKELNDDRIIYLNTPRDLHLPKSFEFAYIHAKGEYIFSVGSDDGLLPWALDEIDKITKKYPEEYIIHWDRGFYAWPGFNGEQENQFIYPREYDKDGYEIYYRDGMDYLAEVLVHPEAMYGMPTLYVNSCFKREYFDVLLEKTGRLWDGVCQDLYMGVVSSVINRRILYVKFPMSVLGLSKASVGVNSNKSVDTDEEFKKITEQQKLDGNIGGYCSSYYERFCPTTMTDTYSLIISLLRMVSLGLISESWITDVFPWKDWYIHLAVELDITDVAFDKKLHQMRYCAKQLGDDFLKWFDEGIYEVKTRPVYMDSNDEKIKENGPIYRKGRADTGGYILDASDYGVKNILGAVQLFADIMNGKIKVDIE